ncbi:MAG: 4a-hydroxytetrahydrobiopterin dehydratase [Candidatus Omnitrophica bacterium]|nr:4a-hydroxytetrahydrobiopterin dehydratase [Candidatus Omnitrophota bacterium]
MTAGENMNELTKKKCVPCEGGVPKLSKQESLAHLKKLSNWTLTSDTNAIRSEYGMKDFQAALDFINLVGKVAEEEGHHPDFHLTGYRKLAIELSTHAIGGLSENDFILAAKIDQLPRELKA